MIRFTQFFLVTILFIGCIKNEDTPNEVTVCNYDAGKQNLTTQSKGALPYKDIKNVTFLDSFGIQKVFDVTFEETTTDVSNSIFVKDTTINGTFIPSSTIVNCMRSESWTYTMKEIGGALVLVAKVYNDFDFTLPKKEVVDKVEILITDNNRVEEVFPYFNMRVDPRASTDGFNNLVEQKPSLFIFGKSFSTVFKNIFTTPQLHTTYYNKTEGIVAFTEANGRKWRFESMK